MRILLSIFTAVVMQAATPVWIDTDPSVATGGHETGDGFALIQAFHSKELLIRGVSIVYGNAPFDRALPIGREIVRRFGHPGIPVLGGAQSAAQLGQETDASRGLAGALQQERLTILVLGPATNVATVLKNHPELRKQVREVVGVAGRRPDQHFTTGTKNSTPLRDLNFEMDPAAYQVILDSGVPLVLTPWEMSSRVWLKQADLDDLRKKNPAIHWIYDPAMDWMRVGQTQFGVDGSNPSDTLAVGYVTSPQLLRCRRVPAQIVTQQDDVKPEGTKPYLVADRSVSSSIKVKYCYEAKPAFRDDLLYRLSGPPRT